jgi:hypothetical protein
MKMRVSLAVLMMSLMTYSSAGAWGIPSIPGTGGGSSATGDPDAFLVKARASEALVNKSAEQLFSLVTSKEEQAKAEEQKKKIDETTDAKEKNALIEEKRSSQLAAIGKAAADKGLETEAKKWDANKKKQAAASLFNLALGGKMAADLVPQGQSLASSIKSNPMMLTKVNSLIEAVKSLGGIGSGTMKVMTALPPVFSAANIDVKLPATSTEAPKNIEGGV